MLSIYNYKDYKKFIRAYVSSELAERGVMKNLAKAANCHPSYLTQALSTKVQITPDHALGIAEYMNLSELERDYFLLMVDHGRSARPALRQLCERKMAAIKAKQEKIGERLQRESLQDAENLARYYSSWQMSAIHILTSIPEFQKIEKIAEKLNISKEQCANHLRELERTGLVVNEKNLWRYSGKQMHVPENSYLVNLHHNNWRQQATLNSQLMSNESIHFTGVYSISKDDYQVLKEILLKTIETMNKKATASGVEDLVAFCCDLFVPEK